MSNGEAPKYLQVMIESNGVDGSIRLGDTELKAKWAKIQVGAGCYTTAEVMLHAPTLKLEKVAGQLYTEIGGTRFRLVPDPVDPNNADAILFTDGDYR